MGSLFFFSFCLFFHSISTSIVGSHVTGKFRIETTSGEEKDQSLIWSNSSVKVTPNKISVILGEDSFLLQVPKTGCPIVDAIEYYGPTEVSLKFHDTVLLAVYGNGRKVDKDQDEVKKLKLRLLTVYKMYREHYWRVFTDPNTPRIFNVAYIETKGNDRSELISSAETLLTISNTPKPSDKPAVENSSNALRCQPKALQLTPKDFVHNSSFIPMTRFAVAPNNSTSASKNPSDTSNRLKQMLHLPTSQVNNSVENSATTTLDPQNYDVTNFALTPGLEKEKESSATLPQQPPLLNARIFEVRNFAFTPTEEPSKKADSSSTTSPLLKRQNYDVINFNRTPTKNQKSTADNSLSTISPLPTPVLNSRNFDVSNFPWADKELESTNTNSNQKSTAINSSPPPTPAMNSRNFDVSNFTWTDKELEHINTNNNIQEERPDIRQWLYRGPSRSESNNRNNLTRNNVKRRLVKGLEPRKIRILGDSNENANVESLDLRKYLYRANNYESDDEIIEIIEEDTVIPACFRGIDWSASLDALRESKQ